MSSNVTEFIEGDMTIWEKEPLEKLSSKKELAAYRHKGFWQPMDTLREKNYLNSLWENNPPWKVWKN